MSWAEEHYIEAGLLSLLFVAVIVAVRFVVTSIRGRRVTNTTGAAEGLGHGQAVIDPSPRSGSTSSRSQELNGGRDVTEGGPAQTFMEGPEMHQGSQGDPQVRRILQDYYGMPPMDFPNLKTAFLIFVAVIIPILYIARILRSFMINSSKLQRQSI